MFQTNFIHSLLRGIDPLHQKTITLTPGQVFNGKIIKIYPGQLASMQLGALTLTAKLEAALTAGNRYWFQVQQNAAIPTLKVLEGASQGQSELLHRQNRESLLGQLGLQNSKLNDLIVRYMAKEALPFTREHVIKGAEILQNTATANEQGLAVLRQMIERNLPITNATFAAMSSVNSGQGLASQLQELIQLLQTSSNNNPSLNSLLQILQKTMSAATLKVDQHQLLTLLKEFVTVERNSSQFFQSQAQLQNLGVILKETTPDQLLVAIREAVANANEAQLKQIWPTLSKEQLLQGINQADLGRILSKAVIASGAKGEEALLQFFRLFASPKGEARSNELPLSKQLASLVDRIGYQHERTFFHLNQSSVDQNEGSLQQLKAALLKAQQTQLPTVLQEKIAAVIHRITGQQLLSANQDGPIVNYAMTVPLALLGKTSDLSIQWEGRKQKNGTLNLDHCRILFYLHLEQLKETIIDVQIQNRIVSLHVINEHEKPAHLIEMLQPHLKQGLAEHNYQLSAIKWSLPKQLEIGKSTFPAVHSYSQGQRLYQGVDIRI